MPILKGAKAIWLYGMCPICMKQMRLSLGNTLFSEGRSEQVMEER
jgi:hypothetical protein